MSAEYPAGQSPLPPERAIAEFQHRNESLHRHHDLGKPSCSYCDIVGQYALKALAQEGYVIVPDEPNHYVTFDEDGWFIEHSLACRVAGTLGTCDFNVGIRRYADALWDDPPFGRWLIRGFDAHGTPALDRVDG